MEFQKLEFKNRPEEEMLQRSKHFLEMIKSRRTVRDFSEKNILTLGDYPSGDVDHLLKKYKRSKRLNYSDNESIRGYLIKMFELYKNKKLKNIKLDYSELRYNHLAKKLDRIFNS